MCAARADEHIAYLACALNVHGSEDKPTNAAEALISEEHEGWWKAICSELEQWRKLGVTNTVKFADRNENAAIIVNAELRRRDRIVRHQVQTEWRIRQEKDETSRSRWSHLERRH